MQISYSSSPEFYTLKMTHKMFDILGLSNDNISMTTFIQSITYIDTGLGRVFCWFIYLWHRQDPRMLNMSVTKQDTSEYVILSIRKEK